MISHCPPISIHLIRNLSTNLCLKMRCPLICSSNSGIPPIGYWGPGSRDLWTRRLYDWHIDKANVFASRIYANSSFILKYDCFSPVGFNDGIDPLRQSSNLTPIQFGCCPHHLYQSWFSILYTPWKLNWLCSQNWKSSFIHLKQNQSPSSLFSRNFLFRMTYHVIAVSSWLIIGKQHLIAGIMGWL